MRIVVVCTGNVARSPALAWMLHLRRPDLQVDSAAVGERAVAGRPMAKRMRDLLYMTGEEAGMYAMGHRSKLLADAGKPDLIIATAPVHMRRLEILAPATARLLCSPVIADPAFGGEAAYGKAWSQLTENADKLAAWLREGE